MSVDDHGLEVLKKSGEEVTPGSKANYYIKTLNIAPFVAPYASDAGTVEYPSSTQEVYKFRSGGISGTVLKTITINYTSSTKEFILNWAET